MGSHIPGPEPWRWFYGILAAVADCSDPGSAIYYMTYCPLSDPEPFSNYPLIFPVIEHLLYLLYVNLGQLCGRDTRSKSMTATPYTILVVIID
jgi:hypothetical protein